jgi:hypothetical protein
MVEQWYCRHIHYKRRILHASCLGVAALLQGPSIVVGVGARDGRLVSNCNLMHKKSHWHRDFTNRMRAEPWTSDALQS